MLYQYIGYQVSHNHTILHSIPSLQFSLYFSRQKLVRYLLGAKDQEHDLVIMIMLIGEGNAFILNFAWKIIHCSARYTV